MLVGFSGALAGAASLKDELRCRALFFGLWVPDLFMKRVRDDGQWTLMDPNRCPGLSDCWGAKFEELPLPASYPRADSDWLFLMPQVIYWATRFAHENYGPKAIYITENGCGYNVEPVVNGEVLDLHRSLTSPSYADASKAAVRGISRCASRASRPDPPG